MQLSAEVARKLREATKRGPLRPIRRRTAIEVQAGLGSRKALPASLAHKGLLFELPFGLCLYSPACSIHSTRSSTELIIQTVGFCRKNLNLHSPAHLPPTHTPWAPTPRLHRNPSGPPQARDDTDYDIVQPHSILRPFGRVQEPEVQMQAGKLIFLPYYLMEVRRVRFRLAA
jgi:hypothetical protein